MRNLRKSFVLLLSVTLLLTGAMAWAETVEYDGLIEPYKTVDIGAPAEGIVASINVDRSDRVEQGALLIELESSVERATLEQAKAKAEFNGEIDLQQAQLEFAQRVYKRVKKLSAVSAHDKDKAATEIILTRHRLSKAREKHTLAQLELEKARALLARREIRSPINGVVVERYVNPGEYVNTQPLLRVAQVDPLRVEVIVPAQVFGRITSGMTATIVPELKQYGSRTATVTIVDKVIDSASDTFGVRLELTNDDLQIPSGLKCRVRFDLEAPGDKKE